MSEYTVVAYYAGIPPNNKNPEKPLILDNFLQGVSVSNDKAVAQYTPKIINCNVAVIQGFVHENRKTSPHLNLRKSVIDHQRATRSRSLLVDSNLFLYADPGNTKSYLRYSYDGVFPTTGFYFDTIVDPSRWQQISKDLGLTLQPWRKTGDHVLICLQRNGGWSMGDTNSVEWLHKTINKIKMHSARPIVVRPHPGDKKTIETLQLPYPGVSISKNVNLLDDLRNCWCTVTYNSSPGVASVIEGIPTFITDPIPQNSQSFAVGNTNLATIEKPLMPDRQQWIEKIAMSHWNFNELKNGSAWNHMRLFVNL